jgi:hypothetical protein
MVEPWDYLDAWRDGNRTLSPRKEMLAVRDRLGALPRCVQLCSSKAPAERPEPRESDDDPNVIVVNTT